VGIGDGSASVLSLVVQGGVGETSEFSNEEVRSGDGRETGDPRLQGASADVAAVRWALISMAQKRRLRSDLQLRHSIRLQPAGITQLILAECAF
jgi:hypothetical protein